MQVFEFPQLLLYQLNIVLCYLVVKLLQHPKVLLMAGYQLIRIFPCPRFYIMLMDLQTQHCLSFKRLGKFLLPQRQLSCMFLQVSIQGRSLKLVALLLPLNPSFLLCIQLRLGIFYALPLVFQLLYLLFVLLLCLAQQTLRSRSQLCKPGLMLEIELS